MQQFIWDSLGFQFVLSLFALLTFTLMEIVKELAAPCTLAKKWQSLFYYFLNFSFNFGKNIILSCLKATWIFFISPQVYQHCWFYFFICAFFLLRGLDTLPIIGRLLCHQWCFSIKVHIQMRWWSHYGNSHRVVLKAILETPRLRDISRHRITQTKNGQKVIRDKSCSWCLAPFDELNRIFVLMETLAA